MKALSILILLFCSINASALLSSQTEPSSDKLISLEESQVTEGETMLKQSFEDLFHLSQEPEFNEQVAGLDSYIALCTSYFQLERIPLAWNSDSMQADRQAHYDRLINNCALQLSGSN